MGPAEAHVTWWSATAHLPVYSYAARCRTSVNGRILVVFVQTTDIRNSVFDMAGRRSDVQGNRFGVECAAVTQYYSMIFRLLISVLY